MSTEWQESIASRMGIVKEKVASAADHSGRELENVRIVAITKGQPIEAIQAAYTLGLDQIGENRVEEALPKQGQLSDLSITWHMVGHIQSRKASDAASHFTWVHSIDRVKIAQRISRVADQNQSQVQVLLECNVSGEMSKGGWLCDDREAWSSLLPEFRTILELPALNVCGLMTMAPWVKDEKILRTTFKRLRTLRDYLADELEHTFPQLSMGMTDDYPLAVEEGATMLRLGRALFGSRR